LPNATASDATTIPIFDETEQSSAADEDKKNRRASGFSYLSERNQNTNDSIITVKGKYIFILFFLNLS
jgi:hypothetical protein